MEIGTFTTITGFCLGILIIAYGTFVCEAPFKFIIKIMANSILGCVILLAINKFFPFGSLRAGINPLTAMCVGILGIPGVIAVILLS